MRVHGNWRITVISKAADFDQRAVVRVKQELTVIPGRVGATHTVGAPEWELSLQHNSGEGWRPNVRVLDEPGTHSHGWASRLLRSKDLDWPGDTAEQNFVLRLDRLDGEPVAPPVPAVTHSTRTTSSSDDTTWLGTPGAVAQHCSTSRERAVVPTTMRTASGS